MKLKPWIAPGVLFLVLSTAGCGRVGNTANTGNAAGFLGNTVATPTTDVADLQLTPIVYVDSTNRTIALRVHDSTRGAVDAANGVSAAFRNNGLAITVPTGWTVDISGVNARVAGSMSIISYQNGVLGTRIATNLGTKVRLTTPGQYALVSVVPGRPDRILDIITISSGAGQPTIVSRSF